MTEVFLLSRSDDCARCYGRSWKRTGSEKDEGKGSIDLKKKKKKINPIQLIRSCSPPSTHP
jgi:hypothetical protein